MVNVRLPDGKLVEQPDGVTAAEVICGIIPHLARRAVAAQLNGEVVDLSTKIGDPEVELRALTLDDPAGLEVARHSCAHVMAEAICALWPEARLVYGPVVEDGFYYDIDLGHSLTPADFARIEAKMTEIVKADRPFRRLEMARAEGLVKLREEGNPYKLENAERATGDVLSFYVTGEPESGGFEDLCRGPHVPSTGRVGAFKVMRVAGAYLHGDASKQMLQRVYGTTWATKKELRQHLERLEEAKKRDHRKLGQELGLFVVDPLVGSGLVLWKPRGAVIRSILERFMIDRLLEAGYQPVYTPQIGRLDLYRKSGHFPYYKESQFPPLFESELARKLNGLWEATIARGDSDGFSADEQRLLDEIEQLAAGVAQKLVEKSFQPGPGMGQHNQHVVRELLEHEDGFLLRPMNCPHHIRIYQSEPRSYRDLPIRLAEFGNVYRYEQSGELAGMTRVRGFTQDDAHIFCTPEQLPAEIQACMDLAKLALDVIGLHDYRVRCSLRDDSREKWVGSDRNWELAETAIRDAARDSGLDYFEESGEAAFYGPKIDFIVKDCLGREWQLGTVQVDYNLPERFELAYVGDDNAEHRPVMVHRTLFGSMERFVGILIEHFAGQFPLWLAPIQATICTVSEKSSAYARQVFGAARAASLRVELDNGDDRIGAKIRRATLMKIPYILVVGEQEMADETVNVRTREGKQMGSYPLAQFLAACALEIANQGAAAPGGEGQAPSTLVQSSASGSG
ncbi:MAG: threonine--tRNA ligase [Planctomycetes bacterium]|nr:threonine--tRNA ligase [Planctomycetota bacterium]